MTTIYVLLENDQIRFIGKTTKVDLKEKLNQHMTEAYNNPEKFGWINDLWKEGKIPDIKPILSYEDEEAEYFDNLFIKDYKFFLGVRLSQLENGNPRPHPAYMKINTRNN